MSEVYLFDWGDTLMVDFPGVPGKMFTWEVVEIVEGAQECLCKLSQQANIYVATGAAESTAKDVKASFCRVGLDKYITDYFCKANIGIPKGTPAFLAAILDNLGIQSHLATMVGDNYSKDIEPALELGMNAIWLTNNDQVTTQTHRNLRIISSLKELCSNHGVQSILVPREPKIQSKVNSK